MIVSDNTGQVAAELKLGEAQKRIAELEAKCAAMLAWRESALRADEEWHKARAMIGGAQLGDGPIEWAGRVLDWLWELGDKIVAQRKALNLASNSDKLMLDRLRELEAELRESEAFNKDWEEAKARVYEECAKIAKIKLTDAEEQCAEMQLFANEEEQRAIKAEEAIAELEAQCAAMREALEEYGAHGSACMAGYFEDRPTGLEPYIPRGPCDCGLSEALATDAGKAPLARLQKAERIYLERDAKAREQLEDLKNTAGLLSDVHGVGIAKGRAQAYEECAKVVEAVEPEVSDLHAFKLVTTKQLAAAIRAKALEGT